MGDTATIRAFDAKPSGRRDHVVGCANRITGATTFGTIKMTQADAARIARENERKYPAFSHWAEPRPELPPELYQ